MNDQFGTEQQRRLVRTAAETLSAFNSQLRVLAQLGVFVELQQTTHDGYIAEFTETRKIIPWMD